MSLSEHYLPEARQDYQEIVHYFLVNAESVVDRFTDALDRTVELLCDRPELGEKFPYDPEKRIRYRTIADFTNYVIFYRVQGETLEIVRVLHGSQDYSNIFEKRFL